MEIKNNYSKTAFNGIIHNSTYSQVKKYAVSIGEKDKFEALSKSFDKLGPNLDLEISARHVKRPFEGNRIIIQLKSTIAERRRAFELFHSTNEEVSKHIYEVMQQLTDASSALYKRTFS